MVLPRLRRKPDLPVVLIYVKKDIKKGDLFTTDNLRIVRPGDDANPVVVWSLTQEISKDFFKNTLLILIIS